MTTDIKELVKRLRDGFITMECEDDVVRYTNYVAADALEAMAGEVERLKTEAKTATTLLEAEKWARAHVKSIIVSDLEAERDRLKAALEETLRTMPEGSRVHVRLTKALGGDAS